jgi:trigger factor
MQVSLSATGGLERRLEVAVPATEVASEVEQRLKQISRTARLKGFRPGKAPYAVVRKQFGEQVHTEVVGDLMRATFAKALSQEKLTPAATPRIEPLAIGPGSDLKYAATFEVMPEVKVATLEGLAVERPVAEVTEADIDAMIESMQRQRPNFAAVERPAQETDRVVIDYRGTIGGKAFEGGDGTDVAVLIGSRQSMPELEEGLKGGTAGETRTVTVSFPPQHPNKALAGQTAELQVTLKTVEAQSSPAVDEEFCRAYGVEEGGVEALRIEVRKSMERELDEVIRNRIRGQIMDALYRDNPFEVPRALLDEQVQRLQVDAARRMGIKDVSQVPAREPFEEPARRRAALGLLMGQIVQARDIKVDRERVLTRLGDLIATYPNPDEARRTYLQNAEAMRQIESAVLEDQVVDFVVAHAQVKDRPMTFKELTGFGQDGGSQSRAGVPAA